MRLHRTVALAGASALGLLPLACGHPKSWDDSHAKPRTVTVTAPAESYTDNFDPGGAAPSATNERAESLELRARAQRTWNETIVWNTIANAAPERVSIRTSSSDTNRTGAATSGGELPPDYICQRESHCTYGINTGNGYYGKWQFSLAWGGHFGLPADITTWTPAQEDAAARELWNGGAGCANWSACD